ncbi:hypothetical protein GGS23DRAFT_395587 [Durotheca rogersii]|uniref:uncharacterized protein n=1 Tax=Durotheca rogersii TaxID=419775 RepID=UPI002220F242|nr:uncharacterized protein GGS23DRAFT_395587 [Durotheca rogersii]KAI5856693.1 hypothetical protein GGS23DRAFT_395587 [Durotheca rogersii]
MCAIFAISTFAAPAFSRTSEHAGSCGHSLPSQPLLGGRGARGSQIDSGPTYLAVSRIDEPPVSLIMSEIHRLPFRNSPPSRGWDRPGWTLHAGAY